MVKMFDMDLVNNILNDIWNFQLVIFGLAVTLFTVLFSFVIAKRDELRSISELIKNGDNTISIKQKETFAIKYINRLKSINDNLLKLIIASFITSFLGWVSERFIICEFSYIKFYALIILAIVTLIICVSIFIQSLKIVKYYKESTKI